MNNKMKRCWMLAGISVLAICTIAVVNIRPTNNPQTGSQENLLSEVLYMYQNYFETYDEFASVLPEDSLLRNLTRSENLKFTYRAESESPKPEELDSREWSDTDSYDSFYITIEENGTTIAEISMIPDSVQSAELYASNHGFPTQKAIQDKTIYYSHFCNATFMIGEDLYLIDYKNYDVDEMFELIHDILE